MYRLKQTGKGNGVAARCWCGAPRAPPTLGFVFICHSAREVARRICTRRRFDVTFETHERIEMRGARPNKRSTGQLGNALRPRTHTCLFLSRGARETRARAHALRTGCQPGMIDEARMQCTVWSPGFFNMSHTRSISNTHARTHARESHRAFLQFCVCSLCWKARVSETKWRLCVFLCVTSAPCGKGASSILLQRV